MNDLYPYEIARLIEGHLNKKLTDQEESGFQELLASDSHVQHLLDVYKDTADLSKRLNFLDNLNVDVALIKVKSKTIPAPHKLHSLKPLLKYAAIFLLLGIGVVWYYNSNPVNTQPLHKTALAPNHQTNKMTLTLSDGQKIYLEKDAETIRENDGTSIKVKQNTITYNSNGPDNLTARNILNVPAGKTYRVNLSDGTVVWLNNLSELTFPVSFGTRMDRVVSLKGEAYFEVSRNTSRPFKVNVNGTEITVLGTKFNVNAFHNGIISTTLLEGSVKVTNEQAVSMLKPGQQAVSENGKITISSADLQKAIAWKNGYFQFKEDGIETILKELSRWYNVEVKYTENAASELHYSGKISRSEKLEDVLSSLTDITGLRFKWIGNTLTVDNE
ncbi:FecR family protein [Pedobacter nyackensis]|uniref:FecR family protein n=1 Tax=Pedobacter nyackensis TaxID=475255 RepID=UPI00292EBB65|nr:FecR domain-containing protein [Pedobacter nyackensis]